MIIAYTTDDGLALVAPNPESGLPLEEIIARAVPEGAPHAVFEDSALPADPDYAPAWRLDLSDPDNPQIVLDPQKQTEITRELALKEEGKWFASQLAAGFTTNDGWTLGLQPTDVTLLTGNYVLAKEAAALGGDIPPVIDTDGVPHPMESIEELTAIMLAYGQHRAALSAEYAARKAAILEAE